MGHSTVYTTLSFNLNVAILATISRQRMNVCVCVWNSIYSVCTGKGSSQGKHKHKHKGSRVSPSRAEPTIVGTLHAVDYKGSKTVILEESLAVSTNYTSSILKFIVELLYTRVGNSCRALSFHGSRRSPREPKLLFRKQNQ